MQYVLRLMAVLGRKFFTTPEYTVFQGIDPRKKAVKSLYSKEMENYHP